MAAAASVLMWEGLADRAFSRWCPKDVLEAFPHISLPKPANSSEGILADLDVYDGPGPWDRTLVDVELQGRTTGEENKKLLIFSSNDYLGLSSHPAVRKAAAKASLAYGMGPRGSAMICGETNYHRQLEATLAELVKKEDCVVCPTGFAANNAFLSALGSIATLLSKDKIPSQEEKIAIFSDQLNHASIIDGLRLLERHQEAVVYVYRHNDMGHLDHLLTNCPNERKVIFTDSLFSMEGDFAPMLALVELRKKHGFLFVIDDAHSTLVCGRTGGGIAEVYGIEDQIDICISTLSKTVGCIGGFIACSEKWKRLIKTRGRQFIFSTALPLPVVAASLAAINVAKKEEWRRRLVWNHVQYFRDLTKVNATSPIVSLVVGSEETAFTASRQLLKDGFHVTAIRPPAVSPDACRLRVTLTAAHTRDDIKKLVEALSRCITTPAHEEQIEGIPSRL